MCKIEKRPLLSRPFEKDRASQSASQQASKQRPGYVVLQPFVPHIFTESFHSLLYTKNFIRRPTNYCFALAACVDFPCFALLWLGRSYKQPASQPSIRWVLFGSVQFSWIQFSSECSEYPYTVEISCSVLRCLYSWISSLAGRLCLSSLSLVWPVV